MKYVPYAIIAVLVVWLVIVISKLDPELPGRLQAQVDSLDRIIVAAQAQQGIARKQIDSLREVERIRRHQIDSLDSRVKDLKVALADARRVKHVSETVLVTDLDNLFRDAGSPRKGSVPPQ